MIFKAEINSPYKGDYNPYQSGYEPIDICTLADRGSSVHFTTSIQQAPCYIALIQMPNTRITTNGQIAPSDRWSSRILENNYFEGDYFVLSLATDNLDHITQIFKEHGVVFHPVGKARIGRSTFVPSILVDNTLHIIKALELLVKLNYFQHAEIPAAKTSVNEIVTDFKQDILSSNTYSQQQELNSIYKLAKYKIDILIEEYNDKQSMFSRLPVEGIVDIAEKIFENCVNKRLNPMEKNELAAYINKKLALKKKSVSAIMLALYQQNSSQSSLLAKLPPEIISQICHHYASSYLNPALSRKLVREVEDTLFDSTQHIANVTDANSPAESDSIAERNTSLWEGMQAAWLTLKAELAKLLAEITSLQPAREVQIETPTKLLSNIINIILHDKYQIDIINNKLLLPTSIHPGIINFLNKNIWFMDKRIMGKEWLLNYVAELNLELDKEELKTIKQQLKAISAKKEGFLNSLSGPSSQQQAAAIALLQVLEGSKPEQTLNDFSRAFSQFPLKPIYARCKEKGLIACTTHSADQIAVVNL